jgi:hypothetical protein
MKFYIVALLKDVKNGPIVGYRVVNVATEEFHDVPTRRLCQMVEYNGVEIKNAEVNFEDETIKITQGSESVYPIILRNGAFVNNNYAFTVIGKNINGAYVLVNPLGIVHNAPESKVISISKSKGLTNAKISKGRVSAKKGSITDIVGFNYNYLEKKFSTPNNMGYVKEWLVRIVKPGEPYGRNGCLINEDNEILVEFISLDTGQFISRYYLRTMLEHDIRYGLDLDGGVDAWTIEAGHFKEIYNWLNTIKQ